MNLNHLSIAITAAIEAGKAIMLIYSEDFDFEIKSDNSPLTIADKKANTIITSYLKDTDIPIISEENEQIDYAVRNAWDICWVVDPLDGTKEFIKRNGEFTVNIALVKKGVPILGVIYVPVSKELYFTASDMSTAYKCVVNELSDTIHTIYANAKKITPAVIDKEKTIKVVGSRSHLNDETKAFVNELKNTSEVEIVSKGSSLKFCLVAEGLAHMYPRFAPTMEWDTAAGQAICEAVGIRVIDNTTNKALKYNKENLLNPYFLVTE